MSSQLLIFSNINNSNSDSELLKFEFKKDENFPVSFGRKK